MFDALQHLAHSQHVHLATHGHFSWANLLSSGLILRGKSDEIDLKPEEQFKMTLPLWTWTHLPVRAGLVVLLAGESNLNEQDTEGLLTPIGIGASLAAAGAKTVVGTLWPCDGLAALCFSYYLYHVAEENPKMPWHQVVARARLALREMQQADLQAVAKEFNLEDIDDLCHKLLESRVARARLSKQPFNKFSDWAGFVVLGNVQR